MFETGPSSKRAVIIAQAFFFPKARLPLFFTSVLLSLLMFLLCACKADRTRKSHWGADGEVEANQATLRLLFKSDDLPANVVDIFSRETGIPVAVQLCDSDVEMEQLVRNSPETYDVVQLGESLAAFWVKSGKLTQLSYQAIPNLRHLDTRFNSLPFDPSSRYTAPYFFGVVGIAYNSEQVEGNIQTYNDIFNPKYAGRIAIPSDSREIIACALIDLHLRFESLTVANAESIRRKLSQWLPLVGKYDAQIPSQSLLRRGEAVAAILRSGKAAILVRENPKFKWVIPAGGAHLFAESLAIPIDSPHQKKAEQFINFLLRPDISAKVTRQSLYFNPNWAARRLLSKEDQEWLLPQNFPSQDLQWLPELGFPPIQGLIQFVDGLRSK